MRRTLFWVIIFCSDACLSKDFGVALEAKYHGKTISAKDVFGNTAKLVTESSTDPAFKFTYRLTKTWDVFYSYEQQTYEFKNDKGFITGETKFSSTSQGFGVRWIFLNSVAFRILYIMEYQFGFEVNGSNLAEIFKERVGYSSFFYDQILYTGPGYYLGFSAGIDLSANSANISNRSASHIIGFLKMGPYGISAEIINTTAESDAWKYETQDKLIKLSYTLGF